MSTFDAVKKHLDNGLHDLAILSGDVMGPSDVPWQDVAGTCALNFEALAITLRAARTRGEVVFPWLVDIPEIRRVIKEGL